MTVAVQKRHMSCETSLGEISSTHTATDSAGVGVTQWGGTPFSSTLGTVVIPPEKLSLDLYEHGRGSVTMMKGARRASSWKKLEGPGL